jgi:Transmembrane amino acid transporter protein
MYTNKQLFPAVKVLERLIWPTVAPLGRGTDPGNFSKGASPDEELALKSKRRWSKNAFRVGLVLCTALIALVAGERFDAFAGLLGALCAVPLALM